MKEAKECYRCSFYTPSGRRQGEGFCNRNDIFRAVVATGQNCWYSPRGPEITLEEYDRKMKEAQKQSYFERGLPVLNRPRIKAQTF